MNLTFFDDETGAELVFNLVPNAALLDDLPDCAGIDGPDDSGEGTCSGDFDSDGSITVNDMLAVLGQFGCSTDCITDLDDDGVVGVADMLALLSVFGQTCL